MTNPPPNLPPPGWYQDPEGHPGLRWWDGSTWTQDRTAAAVHEAPGNNLRDVGDWLSFTFRVVKERAGHLFTLVVALSLPVGLLVSFAVWRIFRQISFDLDTNNADFDFNGPSALEWMFGGAVLVASLVFSMALYGAMQRQTMAAVLERPEPWSKSLTEGLAKAPKLLGNYFLLVLAAMALVIAISVLTAVVPFLGILGFIGLFFMLFVAIARLFLFMPSATCSPAGTPTIKTTLALSKNYAMPMLGRALLLFLILIGISVAGSVITGPFSAGVAEIDPNSTRFNFVDLFGDNYAQFALVQVLSSLINGIGIAVIAAGTSVVYKDRDGPLDPAIGLDPQPVGFGQ